MLRYVWFVTLGIALVLLILYLRTDGKLAECQAALRAQHPHRVVRWRDSAPHKVHVLMPDGSVFTAETETIDMSWLRMPADPNEPTAEPPPPPILPPAVPDAATLTPIAPAPGAGAGPERAWLVGLSGGYAGRWTGGVAVGYEWRRCWLMGQAGPGFGLATVGGRW